MRPGTRWWGAAGTGEAADSARAELRPLCPPLPTGTREARDTGHVHTVALVAVPTAGRISKREDSDKASVFQAVPNGPENCRKPARPRRRPFSARTLPQRRGSTLLSAAYGEGSTSGAGKERAGGQFAPCWDCSPTSGPGTRSARTQRVLVHQLPALRARDPFPRRLARDELGSGGLRVACLLPRSVAVRLRAGEVFCRPFAPGLAADGAARRRLSTHGARWKPATG